MPHYEFAARTRGVTPLSNRNTLYLYARLARVRAPCNELLEIQRTFFHEAGMTARGARGERGTGTLQIFARVTIDRPSYYLSDFCAAYRDSKIVSHETPRHLRFFPLRITDKVLRATICISNFKHSDVRHIKRYVKCFA